MDGNRFDQLTRSLASGSSRRSILKGLGVPARECAAHLPNRTAMAIPVLPAKTARQMLIAPRVAFAQRAPRSE